MGFGIKYQNHRFDGGFFRCVRDFVGKCSRGFELNLQQLTNPDMKKQAVLHVEQSIACFCYLPNYPQ